MMVSEKFYDKIRNVRKEFTIKRIIFWFVLMLGIGILPSLFVQCKGKHEQEISKAFEIRYISDKPEANGETDFKGETAIFDTEQRIEYLRVWADFGRKFFDDPELNTKIISDTDIKAVLNKLKPQPRPQIRRKISLNNWKYVGYRKGQREEELKQIEYWRKMDSVSVRNGRLLLQNNTLIKKFPEQKWRMKAVWRAKSPETPQRLVFGLSETVKVGFTEDGNFFHVVQGKEIKTDSCTPGRFYDFEVELDLATGKGRYNLNINGETVADFVPLSAVPGDGDTPAVNSFTAKAKGGELHLDALRIVSYGPGPSPRGEDQVREYPFLIETMIDEDFTIPPDPAGFEQSGYDDSKWKQVPYERYAHGGERHRGESLYLRRTVRIDDFERAVLNVETVRPSAELFINGKKVADLGRYPTQIDVSDKLKPGQENIVAMRVDPHDVGNARFHMSVDTHSSWFAGLMDIELTSKHYIKDIFAYATDVDDPANLRVEVEARSDAAEGFRGKLIARVYPWYPDESGQPAEESVLPIQVPSNQPTILKTDIRIANPDLWTFHSPHLYKVEVILQDDDGNNLDDYVLTTGLRTISQEGGTFRINGSPEMLNGPLLFGHHYPLERIAQWMFSPPKERWVHDILLTKRMNGTAIRMSVHDDIMSGVNDRRLAEIGDQMGIMFLWQTPAWLREGRAEELFDFEGLPLYAKAVRNHPSIVIWQPSNHTNYTIEWYQRIYDTMAAVDQTRLISPSGDMSRMEGEFDHTIGDTWRPADNDQTFPVWTSPLLARGTMEQILGYGQEWSSLRYLPGMHPRRGMEVEVRTAYLNSNTHAWFDYESEETIGQPNWNLLKGKPYYRMNSYEASYDRGSIGRILTFDEWKESQAWQALSAYEAYRKKRWLGFDGMNWCSLRGGGNSGTYMKPLLDYQNYAKLAFYAVKMAFQPVLAGSKNVDIVYGPEDKIPIMVMNLGKARTVDIKVLVKTMDGNTVAETLYEKVELPEGKGVVDLKYWSPGSLPEGYYAFEYIITE